MFSSCLGFDIIRETISREHLQNFLELATDIEKMLAGFKIFQLLPAKIEIVIVTSELAASSWVVLVRTFLVAVCLVMSASIGGGTSEAGISGNHFNGRLGSVETTRRGTFSIGLQESREFSHPQSHPHEWLLQCDQKTWCLASFPWGLPNWDNRPRLLHDLWKGNPMPDHPLHLHSKT